MYLTRLVAIVLLSVATTVQAGEGIRYLELLNRAHDSVTAVAIAPAGSGQFQDRQVDVLPGGGGAATLGVADAGCRYDLRIGFSTGRSVVYRNVDVCRGGKLVISAQPKDGRYALRAAEGAVGE